MDGQITIRYYGHSCFVIAYKGYEIAIDPYAPYVPGYPALHLTANQVLCSHAHQDHNYTEAVELIAASGDNPFQVTQFDVPHDEADGTLRGRNHITMLEADGVRIVHFGDVGCMPEDAVLRAVQGADAVMIPVGGVYTIDAVQADRLANAVGANVVIPMHYRIGAVDFPVLDELQTFTDLRNNVFFYEGNSITLGKDNKQETAVLRFA